MDDGLLADCLDRTGILPFFRTGSVEGTADFDLAVVAAVEENLAFFVFTQGFGFDSAAVVDDRAENVASTLGGHDDVTAIGFEAAAVEGLGFCQITVDGEVEFIVIGCRKGQALGCGHGKGAAFIGDGTFVFDVGRMKGDEAALGFNLAFIDDRCRRILIKAQAQAVFAIAKVLHGFVVETGRRCDETADVDAGIFGKDNAVRVDQDDVTIGIEVPGDDRLLAAGDTVQGNGIAVGLRIADRFIFSDIKFRPVNGHAVTILEDGHVLAILADRSLAGTDVAARGHSLDSRAA